MFFCSPSARSFSPNFAPLALQIQDFTLGTQILHRIVFLANYKDFLMLDLQTARFRTLDELETWDLDEIHRLD